MAPVILFGLGAAKAGTTWLYRYLARHPDCAMPALKELHWFDTCETDRWTRAGDRLVAEAARREARLPTGDPGLDRRLGRAVAGYRAYAAIVSTRGDDAAYRAYLQGHGGRVTGDLTPAYGVVSEATLARMQAIAPGTRFVFVMRDPLDRLWSNIRMIAARSGTVMARSAARILDRVLAGQDRTLANRCDYAGTLARTGRALDPARLFVAFYETLFTDAAMARMCAFLGIAPRPAPAGARVLAGERLEMTDDQRRRALDWLAPQYHAVAARPDVLPGRWKQNMEALA